MKVLFVHRSVGHNLIEDGQLYGLASEAGIELNDYDHNDKSLGDGTSRKRLGYEFEGGNTNPDHYAQLFSDAGLKSQKQALDFILDYDLIIIKSCYPNSNIQSDEQLEQDKKYYSQIADFFSCQLGKKLVILTSPPLMPLRTSRAAANRARQLSNWLFEQDFKENVFVFNFFDLLAEQPGRRAANTLKKHYRRLLPVDSHPNPKASKEIAPLLTDFLVKKVI